LIIVYLDVTMEMPKMVITSEDATAMFEPKKLKSAGPVTGSAVS